MLVKMDCANAGGINEEWHFITGTLSANAVLNVTVPQTGTVKKVYICFSNPLVVSNVDPSTGEISSTTAWDASEENNWAVSAIYLIISGNNISANAKWSSTARPYTIWYTLE